MVSMPLSTNLTRRQARVTDNRGSSCSGNFVTHPHEIAKHYVCGLCCPPARAGKGKASGSIRMH